MFSDHLQKIDKVPYKSLMVVAAGLVFLCQLLAMVLVVDHQVEKAQIRDARYGAVQMAIADCSENHSGPALSRYGAQLCAELAAASATDTKAKKSQPPAPAAAEPGLASAKAGWLENTTVQAALAIRR